MKLHALTKLIRERFHPLYKLRRNKFFVEAVMPVLDVPVWTRLYGVDWKVRVRLVRHLSVILNSRILEPGTASLFLAIQKTIAPRVFWDVGANIGYYSWLLLSIDKSLRAVLFEPDPDHGTLIVQTISQAAITRARLMCYAVSDVSGTAEFAVDKSSGATGTLAIAITFNERLYGRKPDSISVNTISLDAAWAEQDLATPDLLKVDVEMVEHLVFKGASKLLSEAQPLLIFECASFNKDECFSILQQLQYQIFSGDEPDGSLDMATNFLALPQRYQNQWTELLGQWQIERLSWDS